MITRGKIPIYSLDAAYMITPTIGYVKLNSFSSTVLICTLGAKSLTVTRPHVVGRWRASQFLIKGFPETLS